MDTQQIITVILLAVIILGTNKVIFHIGKRTGEREVITEILKDSRELIEADMKRLEKEKMGRGHE